MAHDMAHRDLARGTVSDKEFNIQIINNMTYING